LITFLLFFSLFGLIHEGYDSVQIAGIKFKIIQNGDGDRRYIWLHGDEQTARMSLENHMKNNEGRAFLVQGNVREADFFGGIIDPNRIFSVEGAKANIQGKRFKEKPETLVNMSAMTLEEKKAFIQSNLITN